MNTKISYALVLLTGLFLTGCANEEKEKSPLEPLIATANVEWTAYKTTDKLPVKGKFETLRLDNFGSGSTVDSVMNKVLFKVEAFSLITGDTDRDDKIRKSFFGLMDEPGVILGQLIVENGKWFVQLKMNGIGVERLPATVTYENNVLILSATIRLADFKALKALEALHNACYELHMGGDGVSKIWDVVDIVATMEFKDNKTRND